jgi:protein-disulfide isomerase
MSGVFWGGLLAALAMAPAARAQALIRDDSASRGRAGAPATVVVFCDFQCPYCAAGRGILDQVVAAHPGDVRIVFRHFPLESKHPDAPRAAAAAVCAQEQGRFWPMHDMMFTHQRELDASGIRRLARTAGLDLVAFDQCLFTGRRASDWQRDAADAAALGVTGTPTYFVNGRGIEGAIPFATLDALVRAALGR